MSNFIKGGVGSGIKGHTTNKMGDFKTKLKKVPTKDLKGLFKEVHDPLLDNWYGSAGGMQDFENVVSASLNLGKENQRRKYLEPPSEKVQKMYLVTQEYCKRKYPDGMIEIFRGVDGKTYEQFDKKEINESVVISNYNVNSWSTYKEVAEDFASGKMKSNFGEEITRGVTIKAKVPIKYVLVHPDLTPVDAASSKTWQGIREGIAEATMILPTTLKVTLLNKYKR